METMLATLFGLFTNHDYMKGVISGLVMLMAGMGIVNMLKPKMITTTAQEATTLQISFWQKVKDYFSAKLGTVYLWIARRLPHRLIRFVLVEALGHVTTGPGSIGFDKAAPMEITAVEVIRRWG